MDNKTGIKSPLFEYRAKITLNQVLPMGLQHLATSIVGIVTPALIMADMCNLDEESRTVLLQMALILSGLGTLLQLFGVWRFGSKLPMVIGTSFAFLPTMQAIAKTYIESNPDPSGTIGVILGAQLFGGIAAIVVGLFADKIRRFFPPQVTGAVIFAIGLSLFPTAVQNMAGGAGSAYFGGWECWSVAIFTLLSVVVFTYFSKGAAKLASILLGMAAGYTLALTYTLTGVAELISFHSISSASVFKVIMPMHFGIEFVPSAIVSMMIMYIANSAQAIGDFTSTTMFTLDRQPTAKELSGGIMGNGLMGVLGSFFGGLPTGTFSQNVGIITSTGVINRLVFAFAAAIMVIGGIFPKFSAALTTIPSCVIGGATLSVFASIATNGVRMISTVDLTKRNLGVVGLSLALGMGITQVSGCLNGLPSIISNAFGSSSVVIVAMVAIILNIVLPKDTEE